MAIKDILKPDTYSYIDEINVNKNNKNYSFKFFVYENRNKEKLILEKYYSINCKSNICKVVDKVYTSDDFAKDLKEDLYDFYYNNPNDSNNLPGIYIIKIVNKFDSTLSDYVDSPVWSRNYNYNYIYFENKYYKFDTFNNTMNEVVGLETEHFYDTVIHPAINKNIIEVLYSVLFKEEPSYKDYPEV